MTMRISLLTLAVLLLAASTLANDIAVPDQHDEVSPLLDVGGPLTASVTPKVDAVAYIGVGYNVFAGQPLPFLSQASSFLDPGFRQPIYNSPEPGVITPDHVNIRSADASVSAASTSSIKTEEDYVSAQSSSLGGGISAAPLGSLTASAGFESSSKTSLTEQKVVVSMTSTVSVYDVAINAATRTPNQFTDQFIELIRSLPSAYNAFTESTYAFIFKNFGTHVVSRLQLGGRWTFESVFTSRSYSKTAADASKFSAGMQAAFNAIKVSGDVSSARSDSASQSFAKSTNKMTLYTSGGPPVATFDAWKTAMTENDRLAPIKCTLMPLHELVAMIYITKVPLDNVNFTDAEWAMKIGALKNATADGCRLTPGCTKNPSNVAPTVPPTQPLENPICRSSATRSVSAYFKVADDAPYTSCTSAHGSNDWGVLSRQCSGGPDCNIITESNGFMTGTQGNITITCTDDSKQVTKSFVFRWSNPFWSSNTLSVSDPTVTQSGTSSGNNVCIRYTIN